MMGSGGTLFLCKVITNLTEGKAMASSTGLITKALCIPDIQIPVSYTHLDVYKRQGYRRSRCRRCSRDRRSRC